MERETNRKNDIYESAFSNLHHIAIVVKDLEKSVECFSKIGIGPFISYPPMKDYTKVNVPDKTAFFNLNVKVAQIGKIQLQLVQPGKGKTIYKEFYDNKGQGVEHLGFVVEDIEKEESKLVKEGLKVISSGRRGDGSGFTYFDTEKSLGVTLLLRQNPSEK